MVKVVGVASAEWSKKPDWKSRSKVVGSISSNARNLSTLDFKKKSTRHTQSGD